MTEAHELKLQRYKAELPGLREQLARCKDGQQRHLIKSKILNQEIALVLKPESARHPHPATRHKMPEERIPMERDEWHMEHADDLAPLCLEREAGARYSPKGWRTTANWRYVTCIRCRLLKDTPADPQRGKNIFGEEEVPPQCANCRNFFPGHARGLTPGAPVVGVCIGAPGGRKILVEASNWCSRWASPDKAEEKI
ncbi:MAG: hypothetical protein IJI85_10160 [Clostridia bacterium]|nr:hypothetical protein [Lentisphaeria bacterium]MBR0422923.1 hypothetical protein [Clostridia bacterium]